MLEVWLMRVGKNDKSSADGSQGWCNISKSNMIIFSSKSSALLSNVQKAA